MCFWIVLASFKLLVELHDFIIYDCNLKKKRLCISVAWIIKSQEKKHKPYWNNSFHSDKGGEKKKFHAFLSPKWLFYLCSAASIKFTLESLLQEPNSYLKIKSNENELFSLQSHWSHNLVNLVHFSLCVLLLVFSLVKLNIIFVVL